MSAALLYVTAESEDQARALGRALVERRLAACANVIPRTTAIYRWEGEVREEGEAVLLVKTRADLVDAVTEAVNSLHSYDCPCVLALPVSGGSRAFLDWIAEETAEETA